MLMTTALFKVSYFLLDSVYQRKTIIWYKWADEINWNTAVARTFPNILVNVYIWKYIKAHKGYVASPSFWGKVFSLHAAFRENRPNSTLALNPPPTPTPSEILPVLQNVYSLHRWHCWTARQCEDRWWTHSCLFWRMFHHVETVFPDRCENAIAAYAIEHQIVHS